MRKVMLVALLLGTLSGVFRPTPAAAHVSVSIGLPGFHLFVGRPFGPPVVYAPPVYYAPPVVYRPSPPAAYYPWYPCHRSGGWNGWHRRGWYR